MMIHHVIFIAVYTMILIYGIKHITEFRRFEDKGYLQTLIICVLIMTPLNLISNIYDLAFSRLANATDLYVNLKIGQEWFTAFLSILVLKTVTKIKKSNERLDSKYCIEE